MDITTYMLMFGASAEAERPGQEMWTTPGTYSFVVPRRVTSISAVVVGGGSGGMHGQIYSGAEEIGGNYMPGSAGNGGGLRWVRQVAVTPGEVLTVVVGAGGPASLFNISSSTSPGGSSRIMRGSVVILEATGGVANQGGSGTALVQGEIGGGNGGVGGKNGSSNQHAPGAGGAGGYSGNGGNGRSYVTPSAATAGNGGAGGGAEGALIGNPSNYDQRGGQGGGVGIMGAGASGAAGIVGGNLNGGNGSNGLYGSGGAAGQAKTFGVAGFNGACRIIWGTGRAYPSTRTADE